MAATLAAAIMAICGSTAVHAQDGVQNGTDKLLLACDGITDMAEKMACFDAVVKGLKQTDDAPVAESQSASPSSIAPAADTPAAPSEPEPAAELQSPTPTDTPIEPTVTSETVADDFGLEKKNVKTAEQKEEFRSVQATIVRSWAIDDPRLAETRFAVELDNGQVWQATEVHRVGLPKVGSPVVISKGRFGGYRMKIGNIKKLAWVRRTK